MKHIFFDVNNLKKNINWVMTHILLREVLKNY